MCVLFGFVGYYVFSICSRVSCLTDCGMDSCWFMGCETGYPASRLNDTSLSVSFQYQVLSLSSMVYPWLLQSLTTRIMLPPFDRFVFVS